MCYWVSAMAGGRKHDEHIDAGLEKQEEQNDVWIIDLHEIPIMAITPGITCLGVITQIRTLRHIIQCPRSGRILDTCWRARSWNTYDAVCTGPPVDGLSGRGKPLLSC